MKIYEGQLKRLGKAVSRCDLTVYAVVEVGDQVVESLVINSKLNSFLGDGLWTSQPIMLWTIGMPFRKRGLIALQVGEGKKYIAPPFSFFTMFFTGLVFSSLAFGCFAMTGTRFWAIGAILLVGVVWFLVMPLVGYFNGPRDGIRL